MPHIQQIKITKFWGKYDIDWTLDPQVNILFGFNGSGKTTLIEWLAENINRKSQLAEKQIQITYSANNEDIHFEIISTFDKTFQQYDNQSSHLFQNLQKLVYGDGTSNTNHFEKYRSQRLDLLDEGKKEAADTIEQNIQLFYQIVNDFFAVSGKTIKFKEQKMFFENGDKKIELAQLSAGEKQLLIILLNVLLQDKKDYILLMDEPEISLHITWQQMLIEKILLLNPNCQLIIATHSPSVFGKGWRDKIVRMEELIKEEA